MDWVSFGKVLFNCLCKSHLWSQSAIMYINCALYMYDVCISLDIVCGPNLLLYIWTEHCICMYFPGHCIFYYHFFIWLICICTCSAIVIAFIKGYLTWLDFFRGFCHHCQRKQLQTSLTGVTGWPRSASNRGRASEYTIANFYTMLLVQTDW